MLCRGLHCIERKLAGLGLNAPERRARSSVEAYNGRWRDGSSPLYAQTVAHPLKARSLRRLPGCCLGLVVTLAAVVAYTGYITYQIKGLRELQSNIIDRNRKDSLQLLRIQNDLNVLGIAMRDMLD